MHVDPEWAETMTVQIFIDESQVVYISKFFETKRMI